MIILITILPFDMHLPGYWKSMYPSTSSRDHAQRLEIENGIIPKKLYADWQLWQGASAISYLNVNTPQRTFTESDTITGAPSYTATGVILTDDGRRLTFVETATSWAFELTFEGTTGSPLVKGQINTTPVGYVPGAAVLPPNSSLVGSGALPQHAWITDAAGTDLGAIVFCPNSYTMGTYGMGGFLNPDYQGVGNYSNVPGFTSNVGIWNTGLTGLVTNGSVAIYDGLHYLSTDGIVGTIPVDPAHWLLLDKATLGNGYIEEWDIIEYDFDNDWLQYRADKFGNIIRYSKTTDDNYFGFGTSAIGLFQWGNAECFDNQVTEGYISNLNSRGKIRSNTLGLASFILIGINDLATNSIISSNVLDVNGNISNNTLSAHAIIDSNTLRVGASISGNILDSFAVIYNNALDNGASINTNTLGDHVRIEGNNFGAERELANKTWTPSTPFQNNVVGLNINQAETIFWPLIDRRCQSGFSNFFVDVALTGMSGTLTLPTASDYCGIFHLVDVGAYAFSSITNPPSLVPFILNPASGTDVTINGTSILGPTPPAGAIVLTNSSYLLTGANRDFLQLEQVRGIAGYFLEINFRLYI